MTDIEKPDHAAARKVVEEFLMFLAAQDWDKWIDMWTDDGVLEFPFAPPGRRSRYVGKQDILSYMQAAVGKMAVSTVDYYNVYPMLDPSMICMEMGLQAKSIATGLPLNQRYISVFEIREGKLCTYREYWNPIASMDAHGGREAWTSAFGSPEEAGDSK